MGFVMHVYTLFILGFSEGQNFESFLFRPAFVNLVEHYFSCIPNYVYGTWQHCKAGVV
jgi:hypothetical protein